MANYTYRDLLDGKLPEEEDKVMLYHKMHTVKKNSKGYYLSEEWSVNGWIFDYLGIKNKKQFCEVADSDTGLFPHCESPKHLRNVIEKLWTYIPFQIGDQIKVRKIHTSCVDYAILTVDAMQRMSDEYITVKRISPYEWGANRSQCKQYGVYLYVESVEGYCWSFDLLDFNKIKKHQECIHQEEQKCVQVQNTLEDKANKISVSISIPIITKTLEIQL